MSEGESALRETPLALYGLTSSYTGQRMLGDSERFRDGPDENSSADYEWYGLLHGDPLAPNPQLLRVLTAKGAQPTLPGLLEAEQARMNAPDDIAKPVPFSAILDVAGSPVSFSGLQAGPMWAAETQLDDIRLIVLGVRFPPSSVSLVLLDSVEPYIEGRREYLAKLAPGTW